MSNRTFTIIKPNAVAAGNTGKIIDKLISEGFEIKAMKMLFMSRNDAARFYSVHKDRPFFGSLLDFMTSGPSVVAVLERENAIPELRRVVGNTDPELAEEGTVRKMFGESKTKNSIHASDSPENAQIEWSQFFKPKEIMECGYKSID